MGVRARRLAPLVLVAACLVAVGCGGASVRLKSPSSATRGGDHAPGGPALKADTRVIRGWSDALRAGHLQRAASYFAVPSLIDDGQGMGPLVARTPAQVRALTTFTCGSVLERTQRVGRYVVARFRLTDRPGGNCGSGVGQTAYTAFVIHDGKIKEWRRVPDPSAVPHGGGGGGQQQPAPRPAPDVPGPTNTAPIA